MAELIDVPLLLARKRRALTLPGPRADFLMLRTAGELADRLSLVERRFERAAAIHCLTGHAADALAASGKVGDVLRIEADPAFLFGKDGRVVPPETVGLEPHSLDLAVSLLTMQEMNDIPGFLVQMRRALRPDGLFLGAMAGGETLHELRASLLAAESQVTGGASPRVLPFVDVRDAGALLQRAGFALPVSDVDEVTVRYATVPALMRDLRAMGATNALLARSRVPLTGTLLATAADIYAGRFADPDGRLRASFSLIWMSGWSPADSQPKPLKPGSATRLLADALRQAGDDPPDGR